MAHKIATGLKVPGLATVSITIISPVCLPLTLTMIVTARRSSPVGGWAGNACIESHMGRVGQVGVELTIII